MDRVIKIISNSEYDEKLKRKRHAAIIIRGGNVVGWGINSLKAHPMAIKRSVFNRRSRDLDNIFTIHAEMAAIRSVKNKELLHGATLVVGRYSECWGEMFSCPCETCAFYIEKYKIHKVIYSSNPGEWREVILPN